MLRTGALLFISTVLHQPWSSRSIILPIVYFHRDCAGIARQAVQCSGYVACLFPLTVAAVLEGGAVHIFQSIDTSYFYLTVHARIKLYTGQCFHCDCAIGKGSLSAKFIHLFLGHCRGRTYVKSAVINSGIL